MKIFLEDMEDRSVYPIQIQYKGDNYLTLLYYNVRSDSLLRTAAGQIVCFGSEAAMVRFCEKNRLKRGEELSVYDFDAPIENPIDFGRVLNNWNLLNTIATNFKMFFEGDQKKYTPLYRLLFRLNTCAVPISPIYRVSRRHYRYILKVFQKKDRLLSRLMQYRE